MKPAEIDPVNGAVKISTFVELDNWRDREDNEFINHDDDDSSLDILIVIMPWYCNNNNRVIIPPKININILITFLMKYPSRIPDRKPPPTVVANGKIDSVIIFHVHEYTQYTI